MGLGSADAVTLREARAKRDELIKTLEQGINPLAERRKNEHERATRKTFAECADAYIAQHRGGWSASSLWSWRHATQRHAKSLAKLKIDEVRVEDVKRAVAPIWDRGHLETAKMTLKRIEAVFNYARAHGWTKVDNPASWDVFKYIVTKKPEGEFSAPQVARLAGVAPGHGRPARQQGMMAPPLEFCALTAVRLSDASEMRWCEVDRSSFRSWCADHGVPRDVAEACLAHVVGGVEGSYQRSDLLERRKPVMAQWAAFLSGEAASNVVELPARRA
jgi:hypothetical protein